jgi:HEAT repeat protein
MNSLRILSLIALVAFSVQADAGKTEPTYKGRPLAYWLDRLQTAPTDETQLEAANAIAAFGADAEPAVPRLVELLNDRSREYRWLIAGNALGPIAKNAKSAVPAMIRLLEEKRAYDPILVIEVLGNVGPKAKDAVPCLQKELKSENAEIGLAAARALWSVSKHPDVVPTLVSLVKDERLESFYVAVHLLGEIGPEAKSALPALRASRPPATTAYPQPRQVVDFAIGRIENKEMEK